MAITTITATSDNAKSIHLVLDAVYNSEPIKIEYSSTSTGTFSDVTDDYTISLVKDSSTVDSTTAYNYSLIIGILDYLEKGGHSAEKQKLINQMLIPGFYKITVDTVTSDVIEIPITLAAGATLVEDAKMPLTVVGSSIIQIRFDKPVRNLFANHYDSTSNANILDNIYYTFTSNPSVRYPINIDSPSLKAYLSDDGKVLTLEDCKFNLLNDDTLNIFINDSAFQQIPRTTNAILTNYDSTLSPIDDVTKTSNQISVETEPATVDAGPFAGSRTSLPVTFNKAVLLPSDQDITNYNNILSIQSTPERQVKLSSVTRTTNDFAFLADTPTVQDVENQYKNLTLNINPTSSNSLPSSSGLNLAVGALPSNIKGALIDSSALLIPRTATTADIAAVQPKLLNASQDITPITDDTTELDLTFSESMNTIGTSTTNVLSAENYSLLTEDGRSFTPDSVKIIPDSSNKKIKLIFNSVIISDAGATITVADTVTNTMGDTMDPDALSYTFQTPIKDSTIPKVVEIIGLNRSKNNTGKTITDEDNALIIKFKTSMATTGDNSATTSTNYKFIESTAPYTDVPLEADATAVPDRAVENSWILFTLDPSTEYPVFEEINPLNPTLSGTGNPNTNYDIHIGYTGLTPSDYRYVENTAGNVFQICDIKKIDATVPLIDLSNGSVTIKDTDTLEYHYEDVSVVDGKTYTNEFRPDTVSPDNFVVYELETFDCSGAKKQLTITDVSLDETGTILTFTLPEDTLSSDTKYIYLTTKDRDPSDVYDIFNKEVTGVFCDEASNEIPTSLIKLSLIDLIKEITVDPNNANIIGYPIEIAATFTNPISVTSPRDFLIGFDDPDEATPGKIQNIAISSAEILQINGENSSTIILKGYIPAIARDNIPNYIYIRTSNEMKYLNTKDINKKFIADFPYTLVDSFNVVDLDLKFETDYDLNNAVLTVTYSDSIDEYSVPKQVLTTKGLTINDLSFSKSKLYDNGYYYSAKSPSTPEFGHITISLKTDTNPIFSSMPNDTAFGVNIRKVSDNTFEFKFVKANAADNLNLNIDNIIFMEYVPGKYHLKGIDDDDISMYANSSFDENVNTPVK